MVEVDTDKRRETEAVLRRLVKETGISAAQASFLVTILGIEWDALVREARLLKKW